MADERQDVILLAASDMGSSDIASAVATSSTSTTNNSVLTKLITGSNTSGTNTPNTFILYIPAFRKIEPKPGIEMKNNGEEEEKEVIEKEGKSSIGRFLAINATKRGVKTCPVCQKKIGYRAKQCKHCSPSKIRNPRKPRLHNIKPSVAIKPIESKTVELLTQHVVCTSPTTTQVDGHDRSSDSMLATQALQHHIVGNHGEEEPLATMVPLLEEESSQDFEETVIEPTINQQDLTASKLPEEQNLLSNASQGSQQQEHHQLDEEGILSCPQKMVVEQSEMVSNVAEVTTTSSECVEKLDEGRSQQASSGTIETVFISSKISDNIHGPSPGNNCTTKYSLQDLICGLLAQNQGVNLNQNDSKECEDNTSLLETRIETAETSETTDTKSCERDKEKMPDNSYDANSVALFLGEMAQRNNGKKRKITDSKASEGDPKVVTFLQGTDTKCIVQVLSANDHKPGKFRKIQPKDSMNIQEEQAQTCEDDKEPSKDFSNETKGDFQYRIMNGNATRRGVMLCSKCNKMIGCRSKVCKHCKKCVNDGPARQAASMKGIKQAVKLCLPSDLGVQIFSVRKCKTGPELRCFVQFESDGASIISDKYTCDYPLCSNKELAGKTSNNYMCEHAKVCCSSVNILMAKIPKLDLKKLASLEICTDLKESVQKLYSQSTSKDVPLVQYVSCRTLAVVECINNDSSDPLGAGSISFAHIRFENVKGQGCFQREVFCSGRSCMAWNFLSNDSNAAAMKACSCVHYAAALWAIACDATLQKDMGEYLDAFVAQANKQSS